MERNEARVGREMQRFKVDRTGSKCRLTAVGVPLVLLEPTDGTGVPQLGVVIVTSRKHEGRWTLPKGGWELDEDLEQCAVRETEEEAGVVSTPLGLAMEVLQQTVRAARAVLGKRALPDRFQVDTMMIEAVPGTVTSTIPLIIHQTKKKADDHNTEHKVVLLRVKEWIPDAKYAEGDERQRQTISIAKLLQPNPPFALRPEHCEILEYVSASPLRESILQLLAQK
jgi:8-oxo-dGTP pyrophosphatase MutT (NUDIX family)